MPSSNCTQPINQGTIELESEYCDIAFFRSCPALVSSACICTACNIARSWAAFRAQVQRKQIHTACLYSQREDGLSSTSQKKLFCGLRRKPAPTVSVWVFTPHSSLWQWSALIGVVCTVKGEYTHQCLMYCSRLYTGYRSLMRT